MIRINYIIISVFLILHCTSTPTEIEESVEKAKVEGLVFDIYNGNSMPLKDIIISINDTTLQTDNNGIFDLGSLQIGQYELSFYSEMHEPLDTLIEVTDTTSLQLSISLEPIYYDYAPLFVGTEWVYELESSSNSWDVTGGSSYRVSNEWKSMLKISVESMSEDQEDYNYYIDLTRDGYHIETSNSDTVTTYFSATGSYRIIEDKFTNNITIEDNEQEGNWDGGSFYLTPFVNKGDYVLLVSQNNSCCGWDYHVNFKRYFPISRLPYQELINVIPGFTHEPDSGLVFYGESYGGHSSSGSSTQKLISLTKGN